MLLSSLLFPPSLQLLFPSPAQTPPTPLSKERNEMGRPGCAVRSLPNQPFLAPSFCHLVPPSLLSPIPFPRPFPLTELGLVAHLSHLYLCPPFVLSFCVFLGCVCVGPKTARQFCHPVGVVLSDPSSLSAPLLLALYVPLADLFLLPLFVLL